LEKFLKVGKVTFKNDLELVKIKKWKYWGTWLHNKLAIDFARWCNSDFAVKLDNWIINKFNEEKDRKIEREKLKTWYLPLTKAIEEAHDPAMFYHYSTEADLINRIVTWMSAKQYEEKYNCKPREWVTIWEMEIMDRLQRANTTFIEIWEDYEKRKELLTNLYNKYCKQIY
jgi:hypothetical protein